MGNFRRVLSVLVAVTFASATAFARPPSMTNQKGAQAVKAFEQIAQKIVSRGQNFSGYALTRDQLKTTIEKGRRATKAAGSHALQGQVQLILMMFILTSVESYRSVSEQSALKDERLTFAQKAAHVRKALGDVTKSFDTYLGMLSALGETAFTPAIALLREAALSRTGSVAIAELIQTGVSSFILFGLWETGMQIWDDASYLLDDPADRSVALKLTVGDWLFGSHTPEQKLVMAKIQSKMWDILTFADPQMTQNMLYNTWRLRIAKGDFLVLLASIMVFSTVSATVATGGPWGTVAGFAGGLVGVLAAVLVPQVHKDNITRKIRYGRSRSALGDLDGVNVTKMRHYARMLDGVPDTILERHALYIYFDHEVKNRTKYMRRSLTALFEIYFESLSEIENITNQLFLVMQYHRVDSATAIELTQQLEQKMAQVEKRHLQIQNEILNAVKILETANAVLLENSYVQRQPKLLKLVQIQQDSFVALGDAVLVVLAARDGELRAAMGLELSAEDGYNLELFADVVASQFFFMGFDESHLVVN